ncbi:hypothetical protein HYDPIDRAFT_118634 [Hydnomerulius pinastri MD-312]|uniref:Uncharacterized protein n=1 Tax=Hydnomerulius pinastri MD-312 TaxID=994086 RepID=A0A0C2L7A1_9AGAM|nr:hypothetical protein HYDPIDRAFT_120588 [Hydnomerulius pinastri MD-312]KIJ59303.1 hypothetical protein HYDPIDRAFT_118634 [Hydnomerulius pinastri MD-312]
MEQIEGYISCPVEAFALVSALVRPTSIGDLPVEIMTMIFREVYYPCHLFEDEFSGTMTWETEDFPSQMRLFFLALYAELDSISITNSVVDRMQNVRWQQLVDRAAKVGEH